MCSVQARLVQVSNICRQTRVSLIPFLIDCFLRVTKAQQKPFNSIGKLLLLPSKKPLKSTDFKKNEAQLKQGAARAKCKPIQCTVHDWSDPAPGAVLPTTAPKRK